MSSTKQFYRFGLVAAICAGVFVAAPTSLAQDGKKGKDAEEPGKKSAPEGKRERQRQPGGNKANDFDRLRMGPNGLPMPADRTASIEAKRDLEDAKTELTTAMAGSASTSSVAVENELLQTQDYREAVLDLRRAQADYDNVRRPIFDALRADSYYRELERKQQQRQKVIRNLVTTGRGSFDWLFPHAMAALEVRKSMTREEIMALAQAPEVEDARERMLVAAAKVRAMKSNRLAEVNNSEALKTAKDQLDAAREKVRLAQAAYNRALADEAEYEQLRQQYLAELRRTGRAPVAGN
jgi:hypothetical protein